MQFSFVLKKIPQATDSHKIFRHFESIAIHTYNSLIHNKGIEVESDDGNHLESLDGIGPGRRIIK